MEKKIEGVLIKQSRSLGCLMFAVFLLAMFSLNLYRLLEPGYRFNSSTGGVVGRKYLSEVYQSIPEVEAGMGWYYVPHIEYSYEVNGEKFVGNRFSSSGKALERDTAESILRGFEIGTAVKVYYRSGSPQESVLAIRPTREALGVISGLGVMGVLLALLSIFLWRKDST